MEAKDFRRIARNNLAGNWWLSVGVAFVASLLGGLLADTNLPFQVNIDEQLLPMLPPAVGTFLKIQGGILFCLSIAMFILGGTVQLGYAQYLLSQHDKRYLQFNDLFSHFDNFGTGFLQAFLRGLYVFLWSLLLFIPGIVKAYAYAMTPFILAEHPAMTANEAITESRKLMVGHKGELFWLDLTFIGWYLLSALTCGIGLLFLNPYHNAAHAAFYRNLTK